MAESHRTSRAARRAVLRWAWRLFRREWRQQLVTICLLTVTVAAAVWASTAAVNGGSKGQALLGDAKAMIQVDPSTGADVAATLAAIRERFGDAEVIGHATTTAAGLAGTIDVRAQDPHGEFGRPTLALRSGRYPASDGEVALTTRLAQQLDTGVGEEISIARANRTVVGIVENPRNLDDQFALVAASTSLPSETLSVLVGRDRPITVRTSQASPGFDMISVGSDESGVITLVIAAVTVSMALVGLVAASSFLVIAKRRQRQLGILGALGATQRHLRLALVANGGLVGGAAALVGTALGVGVWLLSVSFVEQSTAHRIERFALPWPLLALCAGLALIAALGAAWWPARTISKVPAVAAIAQRPSPPLPVHRSALAAALVLGSGMIAIALAKPRDAEVKPWLLIVGLLAVIAGTVLVAPVVIRLLALPARRLPLPSRLALRDLARYQARAAAALAAITLALGIAVATAVVAQANDENSGPGNLPATQLLVSFGGTTGPFATSVAVADADANDTAVERIASAVPGAHVYALDVAIPPPNGSQRVEPVSVATPVDHGFSLYGPAYVATPELLALYRIDPATIGPSTELLTNASNVVLLDTSTRPDANLTTPTQTVALPAYTSTPQGLIPQAAVQQHGWTEQRAAWLIDAPAPITSDQTAAARRAAADVGLAVEARDVNDESSSLGRGATIAGSVVALAILAMTIGLIRGESTGDMRTLTAVGAPRRTRRAITATASAALAAGGVALASVGAYLAVAAVYRSNLSDLSSPPIGNLAVLWVGLPVVAAVVGWTFAGRQPQHIARQLG